MTSWRPGGRPAASRRGGALGVILFGVVVLGISWFLVRVRSPLTQAPAGPSALGDATAERLAPITRPAVLPVGDRARVRVALVRDTASLAFFDDPRAYDRALDAWSVILAATGADVQRITPAAAETDPAAVLVVASTPCLSAPARRAMRSAARRGQGVIFTGMTGVRDGGCREVGYGLLAELAGASRADTVAFLPDQYITIPTGSPLAVDIPPGSRLELRPAPHVAVRHQGRDAYYSDRDLNPLASDETAPLDGALVHESSGGRRVVYFGFELATLAERPWDQAIMRLLVRNAVAFAAGVSLATPDAWPGGHAAAAVIAQDVEDEFENAQHAVDTLRALGVPGTFFVVSELARGHEKLTRTMASSGEVGTHTENHARLGGNAEVQRRRLAATQHDLVTMLGHPVRGMRPPEEQFDQSSLGAWKDAGGTYVFGSNDGRSPSPEIVNVGGAPFVLIGRTVDDDFLSVRRAKILEPHRLAHDQLEAFAKVRALGGLYVMSYHSNMLARVRSVGAIGIVARTLKADTTVWLTTAGNVADWWLVRHQMVTTVAPDATGLLTLTVRNGAATASPAASVTITLPHGERALAATGSDLMPARPGMARVRIPPLAAGGSHATQITLEKDAADAR